MVRRLVAAGAGIVVLLLLIFAVRGCLNSRKDTAFREYVRDASALVDESNQESTAFFRVLQSTNNNNGVDTQNALNTVNSQASQLLDRVKALDHPDELNGTEGALVETFQFRRDGVANIATQLRAAGGNEANQRQGAARIAASMKLFLASDVIYETRAVPALRSGAEDRGIGGQALPRSRFLPDTGWLDANTVGDRIVALGGSGGSSSKAATPGLHGTGVASATLGGQALTPGGSAANVSAGNDLSLTVQVANQGENTETGVKVNVSIGNGNDAIKASKTLDTIGAGETKPVEIPIDGSPPTGQNVPINVTIAAVPGEKKTDNNKASYTAIFTR